MAALPIENPPDERGRDTETVFMAGLQTGVDGKREDEQNDDENSGRSSKEFGERERVIERQHGRFSH